MSSLPCFAYHTVTERIDDSQYAPRLFDIMRPNDVGAIQNRHSGSGEASFHAFLSAEI